MLLVPRVVDGRGQGCIDLRAIVGAHVVLELARLPLIGVPSRRYYPI